MIKGIVGSGQARAAATPSASGAVSPGTVSSGAAAPAGSADAWVNPWGDQYNAAVLQYLSGDVDVEDSDVWRAYEAMYNREGLRAAEDLLGKLVAASGGRLSSGAAGSAAQAQQYYQSLLMDKYPEVRNQLLAEQLQRLGLLSDAEATAYGRHYQEGRDAVADEQWRQNMARLLANDETSREQWQANFDRAVFENNRDYAHQLIREKITDAYNAAAYQDYSGLQALGIDVSRYVADQEYQKQVDAAAKAASLGEYSLFDSLFGTSLSQTASDEKALENALAIYQLTGDASRLAAYYGIPESQIYAYEAQSAAGSPGGGSTRNTGNKTDDDDGGKKITAVYEDEEDMPEYMLNKISRFVSKGDGKGLAKYLDGLVGDAVISEATAKRIWYDRDGEHLVPVEYSGPSSSKTSANVKWQ
jgi:hypothetical protein